MVNQILMHPWQGSSGKVLDSPRTTQPGQGTGACCCSQQLERHPWGRHLPLGLQMPAAPSHSGAPRSPQHWHGPPSHLSPTVRCRAAGQPSVRSADRAGTPQSGTPCPEAAQGAGEQPPTAPRWGDLPLPTWQRGGRVRRRPGDSLAPTWGVRMHGGGGRCHSHSAADSSSAPPSWSGSGHLPPALRRHSSGPLRPRPRVRRCRAGPGGKPTEPECLGTNLSIYLPSGLRGVQASPFLTHGLQVCEKGAPVGRHCQRVCVEEEERAAGLYLT